MLKKRKKDLFNKNKKVLLGIIVVILILLTILGIYILSKVPKRIESDFFMIEHPILKDDNGEQNFIDVKIRFPFDFYGYSEVDWHFECTDYSLWYGKTCPVLSYSATNSFSISQVKTVMSGGRTSKTEVSFNAVNETFEERKISALNRVKSPSVAKLYRCLKDSLDGWNIVLIRKEETRSALPTGSTYLLFAKENEIYEINEINPDLTFNWFNTKLSSGNFSECEAIILVV